MQLSSETVKTETSLSPLLQYTEVGSNPLLKEVFDRLRWQACFSKKLQIYASLGPLHIAWEAFVRRRWRLLWQGSLRSGPLGQSECEAVGPHTPQNMLRQEFVDIRSISATSLRSLWKRLSGAAGTCFGEDFLISRALCPLPLVYLREFV